MDKFKWNVDKMYTNDGGIQEDINSVKGSIEKVEKLKENPFDNLLEILQEYEKSFRKIEKLYSYSHMKKDEDSRVSKYQKMNLEMQSLYSKLTSGFSFLEPFLLSLDDNRLNDIYSDLKFEKYRLFIDRILRFKDHVLSKEEELILSTLGEAMAAPENDFYMLSYADMKFPDMEKGDDVELNHANFVNKLMNGDREIRKEAFEKYYGVYQGLLNTLGSTLYGNLKNKVLLSQVKKYDSCREMMLYEDNVSLEVYDNLVEAVNKNLGLLHEYYDIRKKYLGIEENHMYDVYVPTAKGFDRKIPFEEAKELVLEAVKPLGEEYVSIMQKAFDDNWIDVYPREGKRSGAYSGGCYDSDPYILLNYTEDVDSVFTLIHELGHSIHSYYSRKNNDFLYAGYTIFVAEVASTFNEMLLLDYMMKIAKNDDEKLALINHHLDSFKGTIFRQTMFAEFEREIHQKIEEGNALTSDDFSQIYFQLNKKYFGDSVISDDLIKLEWARIPHFYSDFYVYKYATGLTCSTILSQRVLNNEEGALEHYKEFLKDGCKHFPLDQLRTAGANLEDEKSYGIAFKVFEEKVKEYREFAK